MKLGEIWLRSLQLCLGGLLHRGVSYIPLEICELEQAF